MENQIIQDVVKDFVDQALASVKEHKDCVNERIASICDGLARITKEYTTEDYRFNLAMDFFVEGAYKNLSDCLVRILDRLDSNGEPTDVDFAAYYALSLIRKKEDDLEGLRLLLDEKYRAFSRYPLYYEIYSRYYKRDRQFKEALGYDKRTIGILKMRGIRNIALYISYASTVCEMMKEGIDILRPDDLTLAEEYIESAICENPKYSKYYFVKAKFRFLSALYGAADISELEQAERDATDLIVGTADAVLWECYKDRNVFVEKERKKYEEFKDYMAEVIAEKKDPCFSKSNRKLDELKEKILDAENQDVCASSSFLPPIPNLRKDDKYFFVCYSSADFRSVYCDLIELYKNKIPFKYDERLTHGLGWQEQIKKGICNENCVGVVFYLSENSIGRPAICDEIDITAQNGKAYFCVNLEGSKLPSQILIDWIVKHCREDGGGYAIDGEHMRVFLNFFRDNQVFVQKYRKNNPDGTVHIHAYIDALKRRFPELTIGE